MQNYFKLFFLFFILYSSFLAQVNLVVNPSLETYTACPGNLGEIYKATGWDVFNGSPDYFTPCSSVSSSDAPHNAFGYQVPYSGNSYAGIFTYYNNSLAREILGVQLQTPLILSQKYFVSYMAVRGNDNLFVGYSTDKIGFRLTTIKSFTVNINNFAHYYNTAVITDTLSWVRILGSFVADSAYQYLTIGNFFDDSNTTVTNQSSGIYAYYYIDDVCLSTDSSYTATYTTEIKQQTQNSSIKIYPNPVHEYILIEGGANSKITIQDFFGTMYNCTMSYNRRWEVNVSELPNGLYFVNVNNHLQKIIINHLE